MPYFPGFTLVDANGAPLDNGSGTPLREPHASISGIVGGLSALNDVLGPSGVQGSVTDIAEKIGVPPEGATLAGQVAGVATALAPVAAVVLAPEAGLAAVAYALLTSTSSLANLLANQNTHYNTLTSNGAYSLAGTGWFTKAYFDDNVSYIIENIDGAHEDVVRFIAGEAPRQQNLRALVETVYAAVLSVGGDVGDLAALAATQGGRYPGPDGVTFGTPVELTATGAVDGPLDGCLVSLSNLPTDRTGFGVDGRTYTRYLGSIAFQTDAGEVETYAYLGWDSAIYVPHSIAHPASVVVVLNKGVHATVTPFTLGASA